MSANRRRAGSRLAGAALVAAAALAASLALGIPSASAARAATVAATGAAAPTAVSAAAPADSVHGPYSPTTTQCATCHRAHSAESPNLVARTDSTALCLTCHDGTGAGDVAAQYADAPANNVSTRSFFQHQPSATDHGLSKLDEFGGVFNRHSACADCHNPHEAHAANATAGPGEAWSASGRLTGVSGVAVDNGAAGTEPTYTFLNGDTGVVRFEYQLCLKCHSGFTKLLSNTDQPPSRWELDKGVEMNPANASFHPVEAAGTNQTAKMALSLSGPSPYKVWNLTPDSTIRCTSCHSGGQPLSSISGMGDDLPSHGSTNRGLLLAPYQDRVLRSPTEDYSSADFKLCFTCHTDEPFKPGADDSATNFSFHSMHTSGIAGKGTGGTDIDTPGDGGGNALCSECHFRLHSTATTADRNTRLVTFSPNVTAYGGVLTWTSTGTGAGTCTLVCHGHVHDGASYGTP